MDIDEQNSLTELQVAWRTFLTEGSLPADADAPGGDEALELLIAMDEDLRAERAADLERVEQLIDETEAFELDQLEHQLRLWTL